MGAEAEERMMVLNSPETDEALYRLNGRLYDLTIEGDTLTLRLRDVVARERKLIAMVLLFLSLVGCSSFFLMSHHPTPIPFSFLYYFLVSIPLGLILNLGLFFVSALVRQDVWEITRHPNGPRYRRGGALLKPRNPLRAVKAWKRGRKFYLSLDFVSESIPMGRFGFALKEHTWRADAQAIAEFLHVPLEISPCD